MRDVQVVVRARVGFVFLLELALHRSHVVRCGAASTPKASARVAQTCAAQSRACAGKQQLQINNLRRMSEALLTDITQLMPHLVVRGATAVSVLVALVHQLRGE
jgi:hypothetical protein